MSSNKQKLELTWIGKNNPDYDISNIESRILDEQEHLSYGEPSSENMLIHGDNLLGLKALLPEFAQKIKCIFIDPPYNTGNAFEHYDDSVEHSLWLSLMKPRIEILHSLLSEEGSIWITLDENEVHYMKVLCDEIFGRKNFITSIVWNSRKSKQNDTLISLAHNHILVFSKNIEKVKINRLPINDEKFSNPDNDPKGDWVADPMDAPNIRTNLEYPITNPLTNEIFLPPKGRHWRFTKEKYEEALRNGMIIFGKNGKSKPQLKRYKSDAVLKGEASNTWWDNCGTATEATQELIKLFSKDNLFATPKPEKLLERILILGSDPNDIVLDSFLGSGTTAAVAHKMNRKWIGIELGEHAYTHCKVRLDKVVDGDQGGVSSSVKWSGGGGYKFYELAPSFVVIDEFGNPVIDGFYNDTKLIRAMCKLTNYTFSPSQTDYWKHGKGQGSNSIYVTTQLLSVAMVQQIANHLGKNETLLICPKKFEPGCDKVDTRITIKKIPQSILKSCQFGKKEYLLPIKEKTIEEYDEEDSE